MKTTILRSILFLASFLFFMDALSMNYTLVYDYHSPIKTFALGKLFITYRIYVDGTPQGDFQAETDSNNSFTLDSTFTQPLTVMITGLDSDIQRGIKCGGVSTPNNYQIKVSCSSITW